MNRANLTMLASYLEQLPEDYQHFGMNNYFKGADGFHKPVFSAPLAGACGTVACAAGHGPAAGILIPGVVWWSDYVALAFDLRVPEWHWCFAGDWVRVDNTPHGAAKRIRYLLEHGLPEDSSKQMTGKAPYIFAKETA